MKRVERPNRRRKGMKRPLQDGGMKLEERNAIEQGRAQLAVTIGEPTRMDPDPGLVLEKPTRYQRL